MKLLSFLLKASLLIPFSAVTWPVSGAQLFAEDFDAETEAKIGPNNGTGMFVEYVNYADMTVGTTVHNIPEAPRQLPGSQAARGVLMRVDYPANPAATERIVNLIALDNAGGTPLTFTDNYRLKFDFYLCLSPNVTLNANGLPVDTGTTEQMLWGVGYNATQPMGRGWRTGRGNGMWGWVSTEGGHGGTVGADAALYSGPNLVGGRNMDLVNAASDVSTYFTPAFGADASPVPNCPANQWVEATITVRAGQVTVEYMAVGRTLTKFFENAPGPVTGAAMVGYEDSFASISFDPDNQWMLLDNMVVEDFEPPTMVVAPVTPFATFTGAPVTGNYSIGNTRTAGGLTITAVNFSGANASDFSLVTALPLVIAPGASQPIEIRFNPAAPNGIKAASATIVSDDPQTPNFVISDIRVRRSVGSFLEAHYKLDEASGTALTDSSGNGMPGTLQVREPVVFGRPSLLGAADAGTSLGFLPAQTGTTGNYFTSSVVHTPTFSISLWMKPAATGAARTLFQRDYDFATPYEKICGLQLTPAGTLIYRVRNTDIFESDVAQPVTDDTIWHIVLTHLDEDGFGNETATRSRLYVNGLSVAVATGPATKGFDDYPLNPVASGLHAGSRTTAGAGFSGDLDDFQVYGTELSPEQVWELFKRPGATATEGFRILSAVRTTAPDAFTVVFPSSPQGTYRLLRSSDLQSWVTAGESFPGSLDLLSTSASDPAPPPGAQFYRIGRE